VARKWGDAAWQKLPHTAKPVSGVSSSLVLAGRLSRPCALRGPQRFGRAHSGALRCPGYFPPITGPADAPVKRHVVVRHVLVVRIRALRPGGVASETGIARETDHRLEPAVLANGYGVTAEGKREGSGREAGGHSFPNGHGPRWLPDFTWGSKVTNFPAKAKPSLWLPPRNPTCPVASGGADRSQTKAEEAAVSTAAQWRMDGPGGIDWDRDPRLHGAGKEAVRG
jgi:hypothetical protein